MIDTTFRVSPEQDEYDVRIARIEGAIGWNQPVSLEDKNFYRDHLLTLWKQMQINLDYAKSTEMDLRNKLVKLCGDPEAKKGTEYADLGHGYRLKIVKKLNYGFVKNEEGKKVDKGKIDAALTQIEKADAAGAFIAQELVKWEPKLSLTMYDKLEKNLKAIIDPILITSDGAPTIEIVPPKSVTAK